MTQNRGVVCACLLAVSLGTMSLYGPQAYVLVAAGHDQASRWAIGGFWVAAVGLCAMPLYFLAMGLISAAGRAAEGDVLGSSREAVPSSRAAAKVAVLYTTRNDFNPEAVDRLRRSGYERRGIFVCDDSTEAAWRLRVDKWVRTEQATGRGGGPEENLRGSTESFETPGFVRVMRRDGRRGFKAGNLNAVLNEIQHRFDYFVVCDADGELPADFIERCLERLRREEAGAGAEGGENGDSADGQGTVLDGQSGDNGALNRGGRIAFVQARQDAAEGAPGTLARALGPVVGAHFRWLVRAREREGFLMFYGHGALISMEAWREAGGFPEIATEDLAFSLELRRRGWRGVYADDIVCRESVPPTADRLGRRSEKWIRGTMECLRRHGPAFWRAKPVPWWEKADVLVNGLFHLMPVPSLVFFLLLCGPYPLAMASLDRTHSGLPPVAPPTFEEWWHRAVGHLHSGPGGADWTALAVVLWLGGSVAVWSALTRGGLRSRLCGLFTYAVVITLWLGGLVRDSVAALAYVVTGKAVFPVTADSSRASKSLAETWWVKALTLVFAGVTGWGAWRWADLWLLAPALASLWVGLRGNVERLRFFDRVWIALPGSLGVACLLFRVLG